MSLTPEQLEERRKENAKETENAMKLAAEQKERDRLSGKLQGPAGVIEDLAKSVKTKLENEEIQPSLPEHARGQAPVAPAEPSPEPAPAE